MAAPAQLTKDQVRDLLKSYADAGRPRPNYDQMLRDLGARVGKPGRHGSIPRLIKLLHEIEEEAAGHAQAALPDPVAAQAATLWSTIETALEAREAEINTALERERQTLAASRTEMESKMSELQDALTEARNETQLRDEIITGKEARIQALTTELSETRQALADTAAVIDLHAAREADLVLRLNEQAKAAAGREKQLIEAHAAIADGLREQLRDRLAQLDYMRTQLDLTLMHTSALDRAHRDALARAQASYARESWLLEAGLVRAGKALGGVLDNYQQTWEQLPATLMAHIERLIGGQSDRIMRVAQEMEQLKKSIETAAKPTADDERHRPQT